MVKLKFIIIGVVAVAAVAGITVGIVYATKGDGCKGINSPDAAEFTESNDGKVTLSWGLPDNIGECTAKYKVVVKVNDNEEKPQELEGLEYVVENATPCSKLTASIATISKNGDESEKYAVKEYTVSSGISKVTVDVASVTLVDNNRLVKWNVVSQGVCTVTYQLHIDGIKHGKPVTGDSTTFSNDLQQCRKYKVTVKAVINGEEGGEGNAAEVEGAVGDISTATVNVESAIEDKNVWTVTWGKLENYDNCEVTYQLYVGETKEGPPVSGTSTTFSNDLLEQCQTSKVTVKPVIQELEGGVGEGKDVIGAVEDVSTATVNVESAIEDQNVWTVTWGKLDNYDNCEVTYQLYVGDTKEGTPVSGTSTTFSNDLLEQCQTSKVTVKPVIQELEGGVGEGKDVIGAVGDVSTVTVDVTSATEADNVWTVTWAQLANYDNCGVTYQLYLDDIEEGTPVSEITTTVSNDDLQRCKPYSATVKPVIQGNEGGVGAGKSIERGVGDTSGITTEVSPPTLASDIWTVEWTPVTHDQCSIKYQLYVDDTPKGDEISETTTTFPNSDLGVCVNSKITVKPIIKDAEGTAAQAVDAQGEPPATGRVTTGTIEMKEDSSVLVSWTKNPDMQGCSFKYKVDLLRGTEVQSSTNEDLDTESWLVPDFTTPTCDLTAKVTATLKEPGDEVTITQCDAIPAPRVITSW